MELLIDRIYQFYEVENLENKVYYYVGQNKYFVLFVLVCSETKRINVTVNKFSIAFLLMALNIATINDFYRSKKYN